MPVVTIDGPVGSGKGTITQLLARQLGWHLLDSGALYRILAHAAQQQSVAFDDPFALSELAKSLNVSFRPSKNLGPVEVLLDGQDITADIRTETTGSNASKISAFPEVRQALMDTQHAFDRPPGLIADGRDMGSVVFKDAQIKIYLDASPEERARRRHKQLQDQGVSVKFDTLLEEIEARDMRDKSRSVSPLIVPKDAVVVDTQGMSIEEVFQRVMKIIEEQLGSDVVRQT